MASLRSVVTQCPCLLLCYQNMQNYRLYNYTKKKARAIADWCFYPFLLKETVGYFQSETIQLFLFIQHYLYLTSFLSKSKAPFKITQRLYKKVKKDKGRSRSNSLVDVYHLLLNFRIHILSETPRTRSFETLLLAIWVTSLENC